MIYATFLTGDEYRKKYTDQVQREVKNKDVHILTDQPELFPDSKTELYDREIFSYYDKLTFLLRTVLERKERVTFIDCDWFTGLHVGFNLEPDTFYTYRLYPFSDFTIMPFSIHGLNLVKEVTGKHNFKFNDEVYIGEAIISLPYLSCAQDILDDLIFLQKDWESTFSQKLVTESSKLKRYSSYGVGYGEGGALTAILQKYNVTLKEVDKKKFIHNNPI